MVEAGERCCTPLPASNLISLLPSVKLYHVSTSTRLLPRQSGTSSKAHVHPEQVPGKESPRQEIYPVATKNKYNKKRKAGAAGLLVLGPGGIWRKVV
jgi:hypothetical protein